MRPLGLGSRRREGKVGEDLLGGRGVVDTYFPPFLWLLCVCFFMFQPSQNWLCLFIRMKSVMFGFQFGGFFFFLMVLI